MSLKSLRADFRQLGNPDDVPNLQRFFKTAPGEYGEGDRFLGIRVPETRKAVKRFRAESLRSVTALLGSPYHEERLLAALLLVDKYERGDEEMQKRVYEIYMGNRAGLNNWDIIDSSAHKIVGPWLDSRSRTPMYELVDSDSLWDRRIAIIATYYFIRKSEFADTLRIAASLRDDSEDLIHKAVGWMLREVGNRDRKVEETFLAKHYKKMPRTMLRYAIEKFPERRRKAYLNGNV
jgi:3-methyladenine DNA glycosylase AlkD